MCASNVSSWGNLKIYCFDLDGTICSSVENSKYELAIPDYDVINAINNLYELGNRIIIMTARGCISKIDWFNFTKQQLDKWNIKYHELLMNMKPHAHYFIDDKAINIQDWKSQFVSLRQGIVAGAFDLIHPGYCRLFNECKKYCNHLTIALHEDPSTERNKHKPIHSIEERKEILNSIKYIDDIIVYNTENDLYRILMSNKYDIRFLGSDYINKKYTGMYLPIKIHFIDRYHNYSTTALKEKIKQSQL